MKSLSLHGGILYLNCKDKLTENDCLFSSDSGAIPQKRYFQSGHSFSTFNVPKKLNYIPKAATLLRCVKKGQKTFPKQQLFLNIQCPKSQLPPLMYLSFCTSVRRTSTYQHLDNFPLPSLTIQQNPSFRFAKTLVQATRYN